MEQKSRFDGFTIAMLAMLALAGLTIYFGMDYKPISRFLPIAASILMIVCVLWLMYDRAKGGDAGEKSLSGEGDDIPATQIWQSIFWISIFAAIAFFLGFIVGSGIYTFFSLYVWGKRSIRHALAISGGLAISIYVLFNMLLGKTLYNGVLFDLLMG